MTATMDRPTTDRVCDCGHLPTFPRLECTTGYGVDDAGRTACFECCAAKDQTRVANGEPLFAYLSGDGIHVTNWPGSPLLRVTRETKRTMYGFCRSERTFLRAVDTAGRVWVGQGAGRGMYCRMRLSAASIPSAVRQ